MHTFEIRADSHRGLADYWQAQGQPDLAAYHRAEAERVSPAERMAVRWRRRNAHFPQTRAYSLWHLTDDRRVSLCGRPIEPDNALAVDLQTNQCRLCWRIQRR